MQYIYGKALDRFLENEQRVYLCGNLQQPQRLQHIMDNQNELGVSYYKQFTADSPHYHAKAVEYNYVVSGCCKVYLIDSDEEHVFEEGSLFVIPPMTKYASKHLANTKILFFKSPGGNDKHLVEVDERLNQWLSCP